MSTATKPNPIAELLKPKTARKAALDRLKRFAQHPKPHDLDMISTSSDIKMLLQELSDYRKVLSNPARFGLVFEDSQAKGQVPAPAAAADNAPLELSARLRDPQSGRLDARPFIDLLGISAADLATKVCGVTRQALNQSPTSAGIQDKLAILEEIAGLLSWCGSEAKLRAWLRRPNRDFTPLNGKIPSPMDLILMGRAQSIANKVHNMLLGHPS